MISSNNNKHYRMPISLIAMGGDIGGDWNSNRQSGRLFTSGSLHKRRVQKTGRCRRRRRRSYVQRHQQQCLTMNVWPKRWNKKEIQFSHCQRCTAEIDAAEM